MNALDKLIEAVEAGAMTAACVATVYEQTHFTDVRGDFWKAAQVHAAYKGSLDAALALHEALLPGWAPVIDLVANEIGMHRQCHDDDGCPTDEWEWCFEVRGHTPARAWLLAILRAYRSVQA